MKHPEVERLVDIERSQFSFISSLALTQKKHVEKLCGGKFGNKGQKLGCILSTHLSCEDWVSNWRRGMKMEHFELEVGEWREISLSV